MNKKNLFLWLLYDFANSFVLVSFLVYFSQWLVIDGGLSDFRYNATFAISSILLLITAPTLAWFTDKFGGRKYYLAMSTFGTLISYALAALFAYLNCNIWLIASLFLIGQYFYQLSFSFYNPLIKDVSDNKNFSKVFGIGQFLNGLWQMAGLVLALIFSGSRLSPLFPSIIAFFILSLPMFLWFKESRPKERTLRLNDFSIETKNFYKKFITFFSVSLAIPVLVAFFFFQDALITVSNNYTIYLERVFAIQDNLKNIIMILMIIFNAIGGISFGYIANRIWNLKVLKIILGSWIVILPLLGILNSVNGVIITSIALGFCVGGIWSVSKAYMAEKLEEKDLGYGFSFFSLFERFATFLGPLTRWWMIAILWTWENSYRLAMISMAVYVIIGFLILILWKRHKQNSI